MHPIDMDELSDNGNAITKENFADVASAKISQILCFPGNDLFRAWAVKFLQKSTRGFAVSQHEPWLSSLSTVESTEVILSYYESATRKLDLAIPSANSFLSFVINHPLQFNHFIATLTKLFIQEIENPQERFCVPNEKLVEHCHTGQARADVRSSNIPTGHNNYETACECQTEIKYARNISDNGPSKKRKTNCGTRYLKTDEIIRFLNHVWNWSRKGLIQVDAELMGDTLSHLPESIEEVVLSWAKEALRSSQKEKPVAYVGESQTVTTAGFRRDTLPSDDDFLHSLSILQDSPIFLAAAAASPKLFQRASSVLNQLLIQASDCSCSSLPLFSLCKTFAQETANGRPGFYPLQVQSLILLMEVDPNTFTSDEQREFISCQITSMCINLPAKITVAVFSHFPAWLSFLNHTTLL